MSAVRAALVLVLAPAIAALAQPRAFAHWPIGATIPVWLDAPVPTGAPLLVERALHTWNTAAAGRFTLERMAKRDANGITIRFVRTDAVFGETAPRMDPRTREIVSADVVIAADVAGDPLMRRIVLYLTALHELGHALGLPHSDNFSTIMYSFRRPEDAELYFGGYRRQIRSVDDIGSDRATGLASDDVQALRALYAN